VPDDFTIPTAPIDVLVRDADTPTRWGLGVLQAWRWLDQHSGLWEGCVSIGSEAKSWLPGDRLMRVSTRGKPSL